MILTTHITVGICTYRRVHVFETLASLARLNLPLDTKLRIVVADNDAEPSAQTTVATAAAQFGLAVTYLHIPAHNVALARNACLDAATGDYFAFLDDDELADPAWLAELLAEQRRSTADIILGRVIALYPAYCPAWLVRGDFFSILPESVDGKIVRGAVKNMLVKLGAPSMNGMQFSERFSALGGEDSEFFRQACRYGATLAYAEKALTYAPVSQNRASLNWLLRRHYRAGQAHAAELIEQHKPRLWNMLTATRKMLYCYAMMILTGLLSVDRRRWLLRGTRHLAIVRMLYVAHDTPSN